MTLPFTWVDWVEEENSLVVVTTNSDLHAKKFVLFSVDGVSSDQLIAAAKKARGPDDWKTGFVDSIPVYIMHSTDRVDHTFVVTGVAHLELEDRETHEIEEHSAVATEEALQEAIHSWMNVERGSARRGQHDNQNENKRSAHWCAPSFSNLRWTFQ